MKFSLVVGICLLNVLYNAKAQSCLDSFRIKCYVITPVAGSNYDHVREGKQKRMTDFYFSDHTSYEYYLPLDSVGGERSLTYWLRNYKLLERNKFSTSDHWLIEKRTFECCHQVIKLHPRANVEGLGPYKRYELIDFNNEVAFRIGYIDRIWNKVKVNVPKEGELLSAERFLHIKPSDKVLIFLSCEHFFL
jgi:hypothetical protein